MDLLMRTLLASVDWSTLPTCSGPEHLYTAERMPEVLSGLACAQTDVAAEAFYGEIIGSAVVQQGLHEAALPLVPVLLALLEGDLPAPARTLVVELLKDIGLGESHEDALERGHADLGDRCRAAVREGIWTVYGLLSDPSPTNREMAIWLLARVDDDRRRVRRILGAVAREDTDTRVREAATKALGD